MAEIVDISWTIATGATVYPGDPPPILVPMATIGADWPYVITKIENATTHLLTHVDVPAHFIPHGATLDELPLRRFQGPALVVDIAGDIVTPADIPLEIAGMNILFRTTNSSIGEDEPYRADYVYVSAEAARLLSARGANLVGIDYVSIDGPADEHFTTHRILLGADVLILEGLRLADVQPGRYQLWAAPLKISGGDGAPTRALLVRSS